MHPRSNIPRLTSGNIPIISQAGNIRIPIAGRLQHALFEESVFTAPDFTNERTSNSQVKQINICLVARELGVEAEYFTYTPEEAEAASVLFKIFSEQIEDTEEGESVFMSPELSTIMADTFDSLEHISFLPFFIEINTSREELWKKTAFFKYWLIHIFEYDCNARIRFLSKFRERFETGQCSEDEVKEFIISMCRFDFYGLTVKLFKDQLEDIVEANQYLLFLRNELSEEERWYEGFLADVSKNKGDEHIRSLQNLFWSEKELPMLTFFAHNGCADALGDKHFIPYFDRFLCHINTPYFNKFMAEILNESHNYLGRIKAWVYARKDLLLSEEENETQRVFRRLFRIKSRLFNKNKLTEESRDRLTPGLVRIFDSLRIGRVDVPSRRKRIADLVIGNLRNNGSGPQPESEAQETADRAVDETPSVTGKANTGEQELELNDAGNTIRIPTKKEIFITGKGGNNLESLNLSALKNIDGNIIDGITVQFKRISERNKREEILGAIVGIDNKVPPVLGEKNTGFFIYRLTLQLPSGYTFPDGKTETVFNERIYTKAEPTPEETEAENKRKGEQSLKTSAPATVSTTTLTVQASVAGVVSLPAEPLEKQRTIRDTNIAWEFARENDALYTCELHDDGIVSFNLGHQLIEMLHDGDFSSLCIDPAGVMTPDVGAGEIRDWLREIAADVRQKKQAKIQAKENQAREASEKIELDKLISEHQSLFVIAHEAERKISALPKKDIGELKNIARELVSDLSLIGWSLSISAFAIVLKKEGQEIIRVSKGFFSLYHQQAGAELSGAQRRLHHVIGENFQSVIEILYLGNIGIQRTLISQMKARRKEIVIYEEQLKKGKGRLIVLPSEYHSKTQSGFPAEGYPLIIDNISLKSIDSEISRLKIKYPGCIIECCIIKDAVTLNGVASSLDALEIMNSPRALHILKKRISITYQIIQDPQDMNRSVIEYPKTPPLNGKHSARRALDQLTGTLGQLKLEDINDVFLKNYLQELHNNGIKVGYSMPVTLTKETLEQGMSTTKTPTAD